jgi:hypothetical protein
MTSRRRRLALWPLVLGLAGTACYDSPTGTGTKLRLVEPLNMTWRGKANGDDYHPGETATFSAATNLRATWHFRIESSTGAVFTQVGENQDRIEFTWKTITDDLPPLPQFGYDQHCVATLIFDVIELDPRDAAKAEFSFDIR